MTEGPVLPPGPALYIVGTPIGNLEDITLRALRVLKQVDLILAEDTRKTGILTRHYSIDTRLKSYRIHQMAKDDAFAVARLREGQNLALCSDAGTPGLSDPGASLIRAVRTDLPETPVIPIPGPSALVTLLSASGFPSHPLHFAGFLSPKSGRRIKYLSSLVEFEGTIALFESVHRIERLLTEIVDIFPDRPVMIGRELTKRFEQIALWSAGIDRLEAIRGLDKRGEFVILVGPRERPGRGEKTG